MTDDALIAGLNTGTWTHVLEGEHYVVDATEPREAADHIVALEHEIARLHRMAALESGWLYQRMASAERRATKAEAEAKENATQYAAMSKVAREAQAERDALRKLLREYCALSTSERAWYERDLMKSFAAIDSEIDAALAGAKGAAP